MEEAALKRQREEGEKEEMEVKRQKSYNEILSFLEEDEDEATQDLSSLITTLQQEISSSEEESSNNEQTQVSSSSSETDPSEIDPSILEYTSVSPSNHQGEEEEEDDERERVMRHLLEASDDELGIPNTEVISDFNDDSRGEVSVEEINAGDLLLQPMSGGGEGLWEIEDEAANYYTLLQSELFM